MLFLDENENCVTTNGHYACVVNSDQKYEQAILIRALSLLHLQLLTTPGSVIAGIYTVPYIAYLNPFGAFKIKIQATKQRVCDL